MKQNVQAGVKVYEYSRETGDFHAENVRIQNGTIVFDMVSPIENVIKHRVRSAYTNKY